MDENIKYVLKKPYTCSYGTLAEGSDIRLFRGFVYFNGGIVPSPYDSVLRTLVIDPKLKDEYIKEQKMYKNEF